MQGFGILDQWSKTVLGIELRTLWTAQMLYPRSSAQEHRELTWRNSHHPPFGILWGIHKAHYLDQSPGTSLWIWSARKCVNMYLSCMFYSELRAEHLRSQGLDLVTYCCNNTVAGKGRKPEGKECSSRSFPFRDAHMKFRQKGHDHRNSKAGFLFFDLRFKQSIS